MIKWLSLKVISPLRAFSSFIFHIGLFVARRAGDLHVTSFLFVVLSLLILLCINWVDHIKGILFLKHQTIKLPNPYETVAVNTANISYCWYCCRQRGQLTSIGDIQSSDWRLRTSSTWTSSTGSWNEKKLCNNYQSYVHVKFKFRFTVTTLTYT